LDINDRNPTIHEEKLKDSDRDYLSDYEEKYIYKTNPFDPDSDNDELMDGLEIKVTGTNPLKLDTDGDGIDDFNEALTYPDYLDPLNPYDAEKFLKKIPNVKARGATKVLCKLAEEKKLKLKYGSIPGKGAWGSNPLAGDISKVISHCFNVSKRDPVMQYFASLPLEIKETSREKIKQIYLGGEPLAKWHENWDIKKLRGEAFGAVYPSYYFTTMDRQSICQDTAIAIGCLLKMKGYPVKIVCVQNDSKYKEEHVIVQTVINGKEYVIDYNKVYLKNEYYKIHEIRNTEVWYPLYFEEVIQLFQQS